MTSGSITSRIKVETFSQAENTNHSCFIKAEIEICKILSALSPEKVVQVLNSCSECVFDNKISLDWLLRCILYFSTIRPKEIELFAKLFTVLSMKTVSTCNFNIQIKFNTLVNHLSKNGYFSLNKSFSLWNKPKDVKKEHENKEIIDIVISDNKESLRKKSLCSDFSFEIELPVIIENKEKELTLLQSCSFFGSIECFNFCLINGVPISDNDKLYAIMGGNINIMKVFNQNGFVFDNCFGIAIQYHHYALCNWLLIHNECDKIELISCIKYFNYSAFLYFFQNGTDIKEKNNNDMTPLHFTCQNGSLGIAKLLIESGADIYAKAGLLSMTPLHFACQNGSLGIAQLLIESGSDIHAKTGLGSMTPLHFACQNGSLGIAQLLIESGSDIHAKTGNNGGLGSMTPLHFACQNGSLGIAKLLIESGADIFAKARLNGGNRIIFQTPLEIANNSKHFDIVAYLEEKYTK